MRGVLLPEMGPVIRKDAVRSGGGDGFQKESFLDPAKIKGSFPRRFT